MSIFIFALLKTNSRFTFATPLAIDTSNSADCGDSFSMSALFRDGCVETSIVSRKRAGARFVTPPRPQPCRQATSSHFGAARTGRCALLRMVAWWGVFLWHVGSVAARAGLVSNNVMRSV